MFAWIRRLIPLTCLALVACQSVPSDLVHASETGLFEAKPPAQRVMNEVKVRWEVRDDVAPYCAKVTGMDRERAYITPPLACAIWSVAAKECIIVTSRKTTHLALGHELRHCFEGHYHP
jgi:hypothetical protein